jgi:hypothetical protein
LSRHIAEKILVVTAALIAAGTFLLHGQAQSPPDNRDAVAKLADRMAKGEETLEYKGRWGYLEDLLKKLDINTDSQVLVFSKTSLQQEKISPKAPRAIFFNDTISVGSVQNGELFEITVADVARGVEFYTLEVKKTDKPVIEKDRFLCLACHGQTWAPHTFVATVYPDAQGSPAFLGGDQLFNVTDHRSPFENRWGGWYVTGTHGKMKHIGNAVAHNPYRPVELETENTQNLTSLKGKFDVTAYLQPTSDIVALMTLEHQTRALYYMAAVTAQFKAYADNEIPTAKRPKQPELDKAVENLAQYLTFGDEFKLTDPVKGVSTFTQTFPKRGPRDSQGRSLRDFDLKTRIFKYPLSYTLYTDVFDKMHPAARERVLQRIFDILSDPGPSRLAERRAALEIIRDTKPNMPPYWRWTVGQNTASPNSPSKQ